MEISEKYGFKLPSSDGEDVANIDDISDNFIIIDEKMADKDYVDNAVSNFETDIDIVYDPTSANAQSGIAVAEACQQAVTDAVDQSGLMFDEKDNSSHEFAVVGDVLFFRRLNDSTEFKVLDERDTETIVNNVIAALPKYAGEVV